MIRITIYVSLKVIVPLCGQYIYISSLVNSGLKITNVKDGHI